MMKLAILSTVVTSITAFGVKTAKVDLGKITQAGAAAITIATTVGVSPAFAGDRGAGQKIFDANCAVCHADGQNVIMPEKTLEKEALESYLTGGRNEDAVVNQVTNGKNAMPAFGRRLGEDDIKNVATYVIITSEMGWDDDE